MTEAIPTPEPIQTRVTPVFDHIPTIKEALPRYGGTPGFTYCHVEVNNLVDFQEAGWQELQEDNYIYIIQGPLGIVNCKLLVYGKHIRGVSPHANVRELRTDMSINFKTGHFTRRQLAWLESVTVVAEPAIVAERGPSIQTVTGPKDPVELPETPEYGGDTESAPAPTPAAAKPPTRKVRKDS